MWYAAPQTVDVDEVSRWACCFVGIREMVDQSRQ